jgi:hypothetical protein
MGARKHCPRYLRYPWVPTKLLARSAARSWQAFTLSMGPNLLWTGNAEAVRAEVPCCFSVPTWTLLQKLWRSHYAALRSASRCM